MRRFLVIAALLAGCVSHPSRGGGSIEGVVFTVDGAPLPCVYVTLVGPYGSPKILTMTDGDGRYEVEEIPTGLYDVTTELSGFTTARQDVEVTSERPASVRTRLGFKSNEPVIIASAN